MELCVPFVNVMILLCKSYEEIKKAPCRSRVLFEISIGSKLSLGVLRVPFDKVSHQICTKITGAFNAYSARQIGI